MKLRNRQTRLLNHGTANMVFALLRKTVSHYRHDVTSNGLQIQQALCRILGRLAIKLFIFINLISSANVVKGNRLACRRFANRESIRNMFELINNPSLLHRKENYFIPLHLNPPPSLPPSLPLSLSQQCLK